MIHIGVKMRFKVFYKEVLKKIMISVLKDDSNDKILPQNLDQHVYFPIPDKLLKKVDKEIQNIINVEDIECIERIDIEQEALIQKRKDTIKEMRKKYNPQIMKFCEEYRENNAELFI